MRSISCEVSTAVHCGPKIQLTRACRHLDSAGVCWMPKQTSLKQKTYQAAPWQGNLLCDVPPDALLAGVRAVRAGSWHRREVKLGFAVAADGAAALRGDCFRRQQGRAEGILLGRALSKRPQTGASK